MAARLNLNTSLTRPPPQPSGGRDPAIAEMSKEEKEEMLNRKMEEIKRKNEAIKKRYEEVEADKRYAEELMKKQGPVEEDEDDEVKRSPSARKEMKGQINEERKKRPLSMDITEAKPMSRASTGRGRKLEKMAREKLKAPDVAMRHNDADGPGRRRERPKSEGWFEQPRNHEVGHPYERSNSHANERGNSRPDRGPPENRMDRPHPRNDHGSGRVERSNSRNERRNIGSGRFDHDQGDNHMNARSDARRNDRDMRESHGPPQDRPGPPRQRGGKREPEPEQKDGPPPDPTFNFLADRSRDPSKAEPREVTRRHPGNFGGVSFGNVRKQIQHEKQRVGRGGRGPPQSKLELTMRMTGRERQQYMEWKKERQQIDHDRIRRQTDQEGEWRREWDHDKVELSERKTEPARRPGPPPPPNNTTPPRGGSANRGRGRGRGGSQGPPPNRTRAFSSGSSDDGTRSVAKQDDKLVIVIENEFAYRKKSGGQSPGDLRSPTSDLRSPVSGMPPSPGFRPEPRTSPHQRISPGERTRPVPARGPSGRTSAPKGRGVSLKARAEKQRATAGGIVARGAPQKSDEDTVVKIISFDDSPPPAQPRRENQKRDRGQNKNTQQRNYKSQRESHQQRVQESQPEQKPVPLQKRRISPEQTHIERRAPPKPEHVKVRHVPPKPDSESDREKTPVQSVEHVEVPAPKGHDAKTPASPAGPWEKEEANPDFYGVQMDQEEHHLYQTYLAECRQKGDKFLAEYEEDFEEIDYDQYRLKLDVDLCGVVPVSMSSPTSDVSADSLSPFIKTPTGFVKVIDWAAHMEKRYEDSRSSGAFESLNSTSSFAEDAEEDIQEGGAEGQDGVQEGGVEGDGAQKGGEEYEDGGQEAEEAHYDEAPEGDYDGEDECEEGAEGNLEASVLYDGLEGGEYYVDEEDVEGEDGDEEFEDAVEDEDEYYEDGEGEEEEGDVADDKPVISDVKNDVESPDVACQEQPDSYPDCDLPDMPEEPPMSVGASEAIEDATAAVPVPSTEEPTSEAAAPSSAEPAPVASCAEESNPEETAVKPDTTAQTAESETTAPSAEEVKPETSATEESKPEAEASAAEPTAPTNSSDGEEETPE